MHAMFKALQYINANPRIILLMAWPVFTALIVALILIIWKGPWIVAMPTQLKQLDLLGFIAFGVLAILALNQLAQSTTFFGRLGLKVGDMVNVTADMNGGNPDLRDRKPDDNNGHDHGPQRGGC